MKKKCGWTVQHIKHKKRKHTKYDIYKKVKTESSRNDYNEALNYYTKEARRSKEKFEMKLVENINNES